MSPSRPTGMRHKYAIGEYLRSPSHNRVECLSSTDSLLWECELRDDLTNVTQYRYLPHLRPACCEISTSTTGIGNPSPADTSRSALWLGMYLPQRSVFAAQSKYPKTLNQWGRIPRKSPSQQHCVTTAFEQLQPGVPNPMLPRP